MKQNKARITLFCVVGIVVLVVLLVVLLPSWRYAIFQKPIRTKKLIPKTDQMIGYYADEEVLFSKKQAKALYDVIDDALSHMNGAEEQPILRWQDAKGELLCLELRYDLAYRYVGTAGDLGEYDILWLQIDQEKLVVSRKGAEVGLALTFEAEVYAACEATIRTAIAEAIPSPMGDVHVLQSGQEQQAADLFAKPATVRLAERGRAVALTAEQQEQIYAAFEQMREQQHDPVTGPYGVSSVYAPEEVYHDMRESICLELCYVQPQQFDGIFAKIKQEEGEEMTDFTLSASYDSVVLMMKEDSVAFVVGRDGLYECVSHFYRSFTLGEGYGDFYSEIATLLQ